MYIKPCLKYIKYKLALVNRMKKNCLLSALFSENGMKQQPTIHAIEEIIVGSPNPPSIQRLLNIFQNVLDNPIPDDCEKDRQ